MKKVIGFAIAAMTMAIYGTQAIACEETASAREEPHYAKYACSTAIDTTYIRDYPTFRPIAKSLRLI